MDINKFRNMTFKDFAEYCEINTCTGRWSFFEAIFCAELIKEIYQIKVKFLGINCIRKTNKAREAAWNAAKVVLFRDDLV